MKLASKLHISDVESLVTDLNHLLESPQAVYIDMSDVEQTDTASIQAFCSLQKALSLTGSQISWVGSSKALLTAADTLGVKEFLNLTS